ncbi:uncharacterized protein KQ657_002216 [Scheffersomyces spartinae]|uniref:Uncharacterized protein n=1 Tax=Scheffersomyces spartinae TaxID=45513 RepID=A0A9P7VDA4_9ASCO|nr:uncharacterized protein KQ657_002216 [Scheffersomyces spartinae]KAG7195831.1 hypothetical protein KQ657_002216 [Scheffersomyces spartinae]
MSIETHTSLIRQAKQDQQRNLAKSAQLSGELAHTLRSIIKINSDDLSSLLDKISTIHEIDREIDLQLSENVITNFEVLMSYKEQLHKTLAKIYRRLQWQDSVTNDISGLQRQCELLDQDIRILERTVHLRKNK